MWSRFFFALPLTSLRSVEGTPVDLRSFSDATRQCSKSDFGIALAAPSVRESQ